MYKPLLFELRRNTSHDGETWGEATVEAACRHIGDIMELLARREDRLHETDETGRRVHVRYTIVSSNSGQTLKTLSLGVI